MAAHIHHYGQALDWVGNGASGTAHYAAYPREYRVHVDGKATLSGSADPTFRGDAGLHNPEDLFLAAIAACHMLFYLSLCARAGVRVLAYTDTPQGWMETDAAGGGAFSRVQLAPRVQVAAGSDPALAESLHALAHERCFIANSCRVPIACEAVIEVEQANAGVAR